MEYKISTCLDLRKKGDSKNQFPICICIFHYPSNSRKYIPTGYKSTKAKWTSLFSDRVVPERKKIAKEINSLCKLYEENARELASNGAFSINNLIDAVKEGSNIKVATKSYIYLTDVINKVIEEKIKEEKYNTAGCYKTLVTNLEGYRKNCKVYDFRLEEFIDYLKNSGNNPTTLAIKLRTLKTVFFRLEKLDIITPQLNPFRNYTIKENGGRKMMLKDSDLEKMYGVETGHLNRCCKT